MPRRARTTALAAVAVFSVGLLSLAMTKDARHALFSALTPLPGPSETASGPAQPVLPAVPEPPRLGTVQPPAVETSGDTLPLQVHQEIPLTLVPAPPNLSPQPMTGEGDFIRAVGELIDEAEGTPSAGEDLVPYGAAGPAGSAGTRQAALASKPQLRTIPDIYDVTEEGSSADGFRRVRLVRDGRPSSQARMDNAPDAAPGWAEGSAPAAPSRTAASRLRGSLRSLAKAGLPPCTRCTGAASSHPGDALQPVDATPVGSARLLGTCGDGFAYELKNQSDRAIRTSFTNNRGEAWDVDLPPGGSTVIRSKEPITGQLVGQSR